LVAARVWHEPFYELRLSSLTLWRSHEAAGSCVGGCGAKVAPDEVEGQVDPCGHASRREHIAVVDEEAVGQHVDPGVPALELGGPPPVGGGGTVVEDTSGGEGKRGGADRYQSGAPGVCGTDGVKHRRRDGCVDVFVSGDDERVRAMESLQTRGCINGQSGTRKRRRPTFSADGQTVMRVATEDLGRDPELQRNDARQRKHGNAVGALGDHGPIIAERGLRATVCAAAMSLPSRQMNDMLVIPTGALADASLATVRCSVSRPIVDHSIRTFLFARLLADREGCLNDADYDEDLLFAATVMHDLGLGEHAKGEARFEVEGADLAAAVLRRHGAAERDIDRVWEAIALHASLGIAQRRGLLTSLTHNGVFIDAGRITNGVADRLRQEVFNAYPRPAGDRSIADAIVAHAMRSEAAAPPGSLAFELLRQHREAERARMGRREAT